MRKRPIVTLTFCAMAMVVSTALAGDQRNRTVPGTAPTTWVGNPLFEACLPSDGGKPLPPLLMAPALALAADEIRPTGESSRSDGQVRVSLPFASDTGLDGFMPLRVQLENPGNTVLRWDFHVSVDARTGRARQETILRRRIELEPNTEVTEWLMVPLMEWTHGISTPAIVVTTRSRGDTRHWKWTTNTRHGFRHRCLVASGIAAGNRAHTRFEPASLPPDWRALSGWAGMVITREQWRALTVDQIGAVRAWVRLGGRLVIVTDGDADQPALLREALGDSPVLTRFFDRQGSAVRATASLGELQVRQGRLEEGRRPGWVVDLQMLDQELALERTSPQQSGEVQPPGRAWAGPSVPLDPPPKPERPLAWLLTIAACAALMGPLPWWWALKRGRRPRLLVTVPSVAVALTAMLMVAAVWRHGIGGEGARSVFVEWRPVEGTAYVLQDQHYRSGWLPTTSFREAEPMCIRFDDAFMVDSFRRIKLHDGVWSGDLFRSFDQRQHRLITVRPVANTEAVTWIPSPGFGRRPQVASTLTWPLDELWLRCRQGRWHQSVAAIEPGATVELKAVTSQEANQRWQQLVALSPAAEHAHVRQLAGEAGRFFALARHHDGDAAIPTLGRIRWQTRLVMTGPVALFDGSPQPPQPAFTRTARQPGGAESP